MTGVRVRITRDELWLGALHVTHEVPLNFFVNAIGPPDRTIAAGPPAPYGHRNNQIHFYDSLGIFLNEHHATRRVREVALTFEPEVSPFPATNACKLEVDFEGTPISARTRVSEIQRVWGLHRLTRSRSRLEGALYIAVTGTRDGHLGELSITLPEKSDEGRA